MCVGVLSVAVAAYVCQAQVAFAMHSGNKVVLPPPLPPLAGLLVAPDDGLCK